MVKENQFQLNLFGMDKIKPYLCTIKLKYSLIKQVSTMTQQRLFAFVTEHPLSNKPGFRGGKYNGYVGIIEDTTNVPSYTDSRIFDTDYYIKVHGGVTCDGVLRPDTFILPLTDIPENWFDYRVVGFDCNHSGDENKEWSLDYVKEQTMSMLHQIEEHLDNPYNDGGYPKEEII